MIEHARDFDLNFVEACWVNSQREFYAGVPSGAYYPWMRQLIRRTLPRTLVLVDRADGAVIGYLCAESIRDAVRIHHMYVRSHDRREGRGFALLAQACSMLGGERLEYTCRVARNARLEAKRKWTVKRWCDALGAHFVHEENNRESA